MTRPMGRWLDLLIVGGVIVTAIRLWGMAPIENWLSPPAPLLQIGQPFSLLPHQGDGGTATAVLFVDAACPACRASEAFYRRLAALSASDEPALNLVAAAPDDSIDATRQWLDHIGLSQVSLAPIGRAWSKGLAVTPTIAALDEDWIIRDVALGKLTVREEEQFVRLMLGGGGLPLNKTPVELSREFCARAGEEPSAQFLDVRDRDEFRADPSLRAVNIPLEELDARAAAELAPARRVIVLTGPRAGRAISAAVELRMRGFSDVALCIR